MNLTDADALKLQCKFVQETLNNIKRRKYIMDVDLSDVYTYYSNYALSSILVDCLEYEDECTLNSTASKYPDEPDDVVISTPCTDQGVLSVSATTSTCNITSKLSNPVDGSAFPRFTLTPDSLYHEGNIDVITTTCLETVTNNVTTGCVLAGNCGDNWNFRSAMFAYLFGVENKYPTGFLTSIRLYETDANGVLINSPLDLDLTPANIAQWTVCGSCSAVDPSDLEFGSADFETAFATLMQNISYTLYDDLYLDITVDKVDAPGNPGSLYFYSEVKHQPSGIWMGFNKQDFRLTYDKGNGDLITKIFQPNNEITTAVRVGALYEDIVVDTICGDMNLTVRNTGTNYQYPNVNLVETNFNNIVLNNPNSVKPVSLQEISTTVAPTTFLPPHLILL